MHPFVHFVIFSRLHFICHHYVTWKFNSLFLETILIFFIFCSDSWCWNAECVTPSAAHKRFAWYPSSCYESRKADCQSSTGITRWQKGCSFKVRNVPWFNWNSIEIIYIVCTKRRFKSRWRIKIWNLYCQTSLPEEPFPLLTKITILLVGIYRYRYN